MADELANYKLQLQQVDAALTTDPDNEDLVKLKNDLLEVIHLTEELVHGNVRTNAVVDSDSDVESDSYEQTGTTSRGMEDETRAWLLSDWKAGDRCRAVWSEDQQYYVGTIDEILDDGTCSVIFDKYGTAEVTKVSMLKPFNEQDDSNDGPSSSKKPKTKKDLTRDQREYKKKKAQKKAQRFKQMDDEREQDKNKWIQFNAKVFSKTTKGKVKKSIFASPDVGTGRVGVGTCGVSGKPMTKFTYMEKWKK